ncbi:MAG: hypothetical protein R3F56_03910 [Planctomycetota bacterium]
MAKAAAAPKHRWRFYRAGGVDQVRLETGADIMNLHQLDQKLWVALSCPVKGLEFDERTLALLDTDNDGRVRAPEILAAIKWLGSVLKNPDDLIKGQDGMPLSAIDATKPEGKQMLASAKHILQSLGRKDAAALTVADATETNKFFEQAKLNGDGVVPPETIDDAAAAKVAADIVDCLGGTPDRGGKVGIDTDKVNRFFDDATAYATWHQQIKPTDRTTLPLGADDTAAAWTATSAVRAKVDDYFGRCRLAAFDVRAAQILKGEEKNYAEVAGKQLGLAVPELASLPLASVEASRPLPLNQGLNPAWTDAISAFQAKAVAPLLGKDKTELAEADWLTLTGKLAAYGAWQAAKAGASVEKLGIARVQEILAGNAKDALLEAVAADAAVAPEIDAMTSLEKLVRLYRDLHQLLLNYVSFTEFFSRKPATFQAGTLYLDGRSCDLCVRVGDAGKHAALAAMSKTFLAYCECVRPSTGESLHVAAAFTAGDSDNLFVGRNGIFYDRKGRDYDATIKALIDQPISIGQAFWAPYKKLLRWIEEQVAKRAAAADAASTEKLQAAATAGGAAATGGPPPKPKFDVGVVAALGVAVGGITAALGGIMQAFFGLGIWMPLGILGLVLLISGPSMVIAWLKLRQRNLGPMLDANGWAVNGRVKVNIPLGASLTDAAKLPPGAERSMVDPYAPKKSIWPRVLVVLLILAGILFGLHKAGISQKWGWYKETWEKWFPPEAGSQDQPGEGQPGEGK